MLHIVRFLVNSNIWIALGALAWVEQTFLLTNVHSRPLMLEALIVAATFFIYNLHRLINVPTTETETLSAMHQWLSTHNAKLNVAMLIALIIIAAAMFTLHVNSIMLLMAMAVISIFYAVPLPLTNSFRLRDIGLLKPVFVALVWATVCVALPLIETGQFNNSAIMLCLQCFLFFMAITLPFDIRDMKFDIVNLKHKTLPLLAGVAVTKAVALLFLAASAVVMVYIESSYWLTAILWHAVTAILIFITNKNSSEYHYTFLLDGTILIGYVLFYFIA